MTIQNKAIALLAVLLALVIWDDWRRAHAPAAPAVAASATAQVANQTAVSATPIAQQRESERVVTQLHCSDGTTVTQTDSRHDVATAAAPVAVTTNTQSTATASASVAQPATPSPYDAYHYSLRVDTNPRATREVGVSIGVRLGALPLQVVGGVQLQSGSVQARVGLQLDM